MPFAKSFATAALVVLCASPAVAQTYGPYGYDTGGALGFDWDGFYAGVYGGGVPFSDDPSWVGGVFTGVNIALDAFVLGAEAQVGGSFAEDDMGIDALVLGRGGVSLGDALVFGTAGGGLAGGDGSYAIGGGAEYGFTNYMSARVDALGTGEWGAGPDELRLTAGLAFHM